jgi:hypothetical protein
MDCGPLGACRELGTTECCYSARVVRVTGLGIHTIEYIVRMAVVYPGTVLVLALMEMIDKHC